MVEVEVAQRTGDEGSLPLAMRNALLPLAGEEGREIGLGGVFRVESGGIRSHVMPDYDCIGHEYYDTEREEIVAEFLRYFEPVGPGLLCFSVLWTGDPTGGELDLRPLSEHTHFYHPGDDTMGGHYHHDVTPDEIHYRGWFAPAGAVHPRRQHRRAAASGPRRPSEARPPGRDEHGSSGWLGPGPAEAAAGQ